MRDFTAKFVRLAITYLEETWRNDQSEACKVRCLQMGHAVGLILSAGSICEGMIAWNNYRLNRFLPLVSGKIDGRFPIVDWLSGVSCETYGNFDLFVDERDAVRLVEEIERSNSADARESDSVEESETEV